MFAFLSRPDHENRRLVVFAFVLIANLLIIGCALLLWNANAISDVNITCAILILLALCGLVIFCCMSCLLLCVVSGGDVFARKLDVQTVYPTPEFTYYNSTMLGKMVFSVLSTMPVGSWKTNSADSVVSSAASPWHSVKRPAALTAQLNSTQDSSSDYLRLY